MTLMPLSVQAPEARLYSTLLLQLTRRCHKLMSKSGKDYIDTEPQTIMCQRFTIPLLPKGDLSA